MTSTYLQAKTPSKRTPSSQHQDKENQGYASTGQKGKRRSAVRTPLKSPQDEGKRRRNCHRLDIDALSPKQAAQVEVPSLFLGTLT